MTSSSASAQPSPETFVESWLADTVTAETDPILAALAPARERAADLGVPGCSPAVGALLASVARMLDARTAVEIGTGAGLSGLWLLSGMREDGVLTTIDTDPEHQRAARAAFADGAVATSRTRAINGRAGEVLPRLADDSYELVFCDVDSPEQHRYVTEAVRLLRSGGALIVHGPARVDTHRVLTGDTTLLPLALPLADGVVCVVKR